jgi:hypothetical protein
MASLLDSWHRPGARPGDGTLKLISRKSSRTWASATSRRSAPNWPRSRHSRHCPKARLGMRMRGVPGVIIASVEADPFRGERCAFCGRAYPGEQEAGANQALGAGELSLIGRLIEAAWKHKIGCEVLKSRCASLLAFYLGMVPDCHTEADLADHLGVDPAALPRSKLLLRAGIAGPLPPPPPGPQTAQPAIVEERGKA